MKHGDAASPGAPFAVDCARLDGGTRLWAAYPTREQAEAAAVALRAVGLQVNVRKSDAGAMPNSDGND